MIITNGIVTAERTIRPADYESKKASVTLSFAIEDGEDADAVIERAGLMAHQHMFKMLRRSEAPATAETLQRSSVKRPPAPVVEAPDPQTPTGNDTSNDEGNSQSDLPKPITDAMLDDLVQKTRARNIMPDHIKAEIAALTGQPGKSMKSLDQEGRARLVKALEALRAT